MGPSTEETQKNKLLVSAIQAATRVEVWSSYFFLGSDIVLFWTMLTFMLSLQVSEPVVSGQRQVKRSHFDDGGETIVTEEPFSVSKIVGVANWFPGRSSKAECKKLRRVYRRRARGEGA